MDFVNVSGQGPAPADSELGALRGTRRTCVAFKKVKGKYRCKRFVNRRGLPVGHGTKAQRRSKSNKRQPYGVARARGAKVVRGKKSGTRPASRRRKASTRRKARKPVYTLRKGRCYRKLVSGKLKITKMARCKPGRKTASKRRGRKGAPSKAAARKGGKKAARQNRRNAKGRFIKGRKAATKRKSGGRKKATGAKRSMTRSYRGWTVGYVKRGKGWACIGRKGTTKKVFGGKAAKACKGLRTRASLRGAGMPIEDLNLDFAGMSTLMGMPVSFAGPNVHEPTSDVAAVISDGDLGRYAAKASTSGRKRRSDAGSSRRCTKVKRSRTGSCVCAKWAKGKARPGEKLTDKCNSAGLRLAIAPHLGRRHKRGLRGIFAGMDALGAPAAGMAEAANEEFLADATPELGEVPRHCTKFDTVWDEALEKEVKVCAEFGDSIAVEDLNGAPTLAVGPSLDDSDLAGPLAKNYGFGAVGGGTGPATAAVGGALAASIMAKHVVPLLGPLASVQMAGTLIPAAVAGVLAWRPQTRSLGIGALTGIGILAAYEMVQKIGIGGSLAGYEFGAITADMDGYDLGAIVGDMDGYDGMGDYDDVDVLSDYDDVDVLSGDLGEEGGVDVLSGAFGSLPFAGAI